MYVCMYTEQYILHPWNHNFTEYADYNLEKFWKDIYIPLTWWQSNELGRKWQHALGRAATYTYSTNSSPQKCDCYMGAGYLQMQLIAATFCSSLKLLANAHNEKTASIIYIYIYIYICRRSHWTCALRRRSAAAR
jgi:hypothetical protein